MAVPLDVVDVLKVFNAAEMRTKGTELEKYVKNQGRGRKRSAKGTGGKGRTHTTSSRHLDETPVRAAGGAKSSKWRQQSSQFREAIRQVGSVARKHGKHGAPISRTKIGPTGLFPSAVRLDGFNLDPLSFGGALG